MFEFLAAVARISKKKKKVFELYGQLQNMFLYHFFRYWSHVVQCTSCSGALKTLKAIEVSLQVVSVAIIGFFAVAKQSLVSNIAKTTVISVVVLCFATSRWLSHFIHKTFYFHDYNHAFK